MKKLNTIQNEKRLIPVELIEQVFKRGLLKEFQAFMLLNFYSNSGIYSSKKDVHNVLEQQWCVKTSKCRIKSLIKLNWLGHEKRVNRFHIRSIDFIHHNWNLNTTLATILTKDKFDHFQLFLFASVISSGIHFLRKRKPQKRHVKHVMLPMESNRAYQAQKGIPFALSLIIDKTGYSQGYCSKLVHKTIDVGYLVMERDVQYALLGKHHANYVKKYTDQFRRVIYRDGIYLEVGPNLYMNRLNIKRKKSLSKWKKRKT